jgi:hypothetical protein
MNAYLIFIDDTDSGINDANLEAVEKQIGDSKVDNLFLIIKSNGGSPFSSVAIMNILNSRFTTISTIVPQYAKSAATLMALGTNDIYMSERSALGPLDLPIEHHRDGSRISALDVQNTITTMAGLIGSIAEDRYKFLRDRQTSKLEASRFALENATDFLKPVVQQIDPYHLQKAYRELRIGYWYAMDMLSKRMMKGNSTQSGKTARTLVQDFPAHEYSIFRDDAKNMLKLDIKDLNSLAIWNDKIKPIYDKVKHKTYHVEYGILKEEIKKNDASNKEKKSKGNK